MIKKSYSFMIITFLVMFFISINNVKAFTYNLNVDFYNVLTFNGMSKSLLPYGGQTGNGEVYYGPLDLTINCSTNWCGVEFFYNATYLTNSSSTDTISYYAVSSQLNSSNYPACTVSADTISCLVPTGTLIRGVSLYFPLTQGSISTVIDTNLIGKANIYNVPANTQNSVVSAINSQSQQQHQDSQAINNSINDSNVDSASSSANTWNSKNASNGVITQLLTLPITLLNAIVSGIQTSCSSFNLGNLFGTDIVFPCISLSNLIGSTLFTTIDLLISGFMIYNISKKLIKIFNDFTNLKSNQIDEIYGGGSN